MQTSWNAMDIDGYTFVLLCELAENIMLLFNGLNLPNILEIKRA